MRTLGVDLAAQPAKTAACVIEWAAGTAIVSELRLGSADRDITELASECNAIGIDAPFGWPLPFVEFVGSPVSPPPRPMAWTSELRDGLCFRLTDERVRDVLGAWPLSVSSDRIAIPAMRCAILLDALGVADHSGDGRVFEVYPAVALKVWGFPWRGYKPRGPRLGRDLSALSALVAAFSSRCPWLRITDTGRAACLRSDDAFDAVIASLVARAATLGLTTRSGPGDSERARVEGWIAVPSAGSLELLASP